MRFGSLMPKIKKIFFSIFIYYNFSSNSNFTSTFCGVLCMLLTNSHAINEENLR